MEEEKEELQPYFKQAKEKRWVLVKAMKNDDISTANEVIDQVVAFGREVERLRKKEITLTELEQKEEIQTIVKPSVVKKKEKKGLFGLFTKEKSKKKIAASPAKEKLTAKKTATLTSTQYTKELKKVESELAKREVELEGLKGAYANLSAEMGEMRRMLENKQAADHDELGVQLTELKTTLEKLHSTMNKEFASKKEAYKEFGIELLHLAVKVAEIEELVEDGDLVTEVDVLNLNHSVSALEKKLVLIEAKEKQRRLELVERIQSDQQKMVKKLESKADTKKIIGAMKQYVAEVKTEIDDREAKIASEMQVELKSSYYTLSQKIKKIETDLEKAKNKKDLEAIHKKVSALNQHIEHIREEETHIQRELEQQHLSDDALLQKIESLGGRLEKSDEMDQIAISDLHKTIEALEMQLQARPGTKDVNSMRGSLRYLKGKLDKLEEHVLVCEICGKKCKNPRGLLLHKKMAHHGKKKVTKPKKKLVKKKTTKKKPTKKKLVKKKTKKKLVKKKVVKKKSKVKKKPVKKKKLLGIWGG